MDNSDTGESSCRRKPSKDKMSDSERPLKKAKFAWQVKGRYHLKDQEEPSDGNNRENNSPSVTTPSPNDEISESINKDDTETSSKTEENLEILGDYLLKQQDFSLNSIQVSSSVPNTKIKKSKRVNETFLEPMVSSETLTDTKMSFISYIDELEIERSTLQESPPGGLMYEPEMSPPPMRRQRVLKTEDQYLARWQARQIAKGFVDNTINRVLDSWLVAPLPQTYEDSRSVVMDVAEFFDNLPANNAVENEGILMAISAHGLQNQTGTHNTESRLQSFESGLHLNYDSSPNLNSETTQYMFSSNSNDDINSNNLFGSLSSQSNRNLNDADVLPNDISSNENNSKVSDCNTPNSASSSESQAWRHAQACNCSHIPRRKNVSRNIPFHRRDTDHHLHTSPVREESPSASEDIPAPSKANDIKTDVSLTDDKSSDNSINDEYSHNTNPSTDLYPIPNEMQEFDEHFDFMDAAVSFAIQNKGLTSFNGVDYG